MSIDVQLGKETLDSLKFLAKSHRELHNGRIATEMKLVITYLSFCVACVFLAYRGDVSSQNMFVFKLGVVAGMLTLAIASVLLLYGSGQANRVSQNVAERAEDVICKALNEACVPPAQSEEGLCDLLQKITFKPTKKMPGFHPCRSRWLLQVVIVIGAAIACAAMIWALSDSSSI